MGLWIAQVLQVFLVLVPIVAIGRPDAAADSRHNNHHRNSHDDGTVQIALDKRGASHMRREDLGADQTAMHAARRQHPKHQHHRHQKDMFDSSLIADTKVTAEHEVRHAKAQAAEEDATSIEPPDGTQTGTDAAGGEDLETDEQKLKKMDQVIVSSEEKAGLPDSTKTTPEPEDEGPTREDEEANMMMIIIISIVVIVGSCGAAFSIKRSRAGAAKKAEVAEGAEGEEGGEGEAAGEDAAEGDAPAAEAAAAEDAPLAAS